MRHAIAGHRPGQTWHVSADGRSRFVATDPVDGGAAFTKAEVEALKSAGHDVVRVDDEAPGEAPKALDELQAEADARDRREANRQLAEQTAATAGELPAKSKFSKQK